MDRTTLTLCLSVIPTAVLLGLTLTYIPPSSPNRLLMLPAILSGAALTLIAAIRTTDITAMHTFIGTEYSPLLALRVVDLVCLSWVYYQDDLRDAAATAKNCSTNQSIVLDPSPFKLMNPLWWSVDLVINYRQVGTARQVKNIPRFNSKRPSYIPSRRSFLLFRISRFVLFYLLMDFVDTQPVTDAETKFAPGKERIVARILGGKFLLADFTETVSITAGFLVCTCFTLMLGYDFLSIVGVGLGVNRVEDWPPLYGSIKEAYSLSRFWGVFWHQQFRQAVTSGSSFIAHTLLQLPRTSSTTSSTSRLLARYTKIFLAFLLSGLIHLCSDLILHIPLHDSGAITFFSLQSLGLMIEQAVQYFYHRATGTTGNMNDKKEKEKIENLEPKAWQRVLGYIWVATFLLCSSPTWIFPGLRNGASNARAVPIPILPRH